MNHVYRLSLLAGMVMIWSLPAWAQLPPNQPEQDCINALPVCQNIYTQANSYVGEGLNPNEINSGPSCLGSGERNDTWYIFTVQTSGNVAFTITPVTLSNDYDWAVYNLTTANCSDIFNIPALEVSCNYSGASGPTGPNGLPGSQNEPVIPVLAGETYVINVSNFTGSTTGYSINFSASTATIFDNVPPTLDTVLTSCGSANITVQFSENVKCATVNPSDFVITGPGGPYTVTGVVGGSCTGGTFENVFDLVISPAITLSGTYNVALVGPVEDNCGNQATLSSEDIFIGQGVMTASASPDSICAGQPTTLTTNLSSTPGYTFVWTPGGFTSGTIQVSPAASTLYTVVATDPAGCARTATVGVIVKPTPQPAFSLPPQACQGQPVGIVYTGNATPFATYSWDFDAPDILLGTGPGPFQAVYNTVGPKTISLSILQNGCQGPTLSQTIQVNLLPAAVFTGPDDVCEGDTAVFTYQGNAPATAAFIWNFPGASFTQNMSAPGSTIGPYKVVWPSGGVRNVTLQVTNNGCPSPLVTKPVTVFARPSVSIEPEANQCFPGNSFTFVPAGDPADTYLWNFGPSAV
ncbi:MAG: Ig-like domain-containing protein, partial [Bacteroidia bacterium]|nr:Ig-like domain-containing protein [Bacteroidia bacterium]